MLLHISFFVTQQRQQQQQQQRQRNHNEKNKQTTATATAATKIDRIIRYTCCQWMKGMFFFLDFDNGQRQDETRLKLMRITELIQR